MFLKTVHFAKDPLGKPCPSLLHCLNRVGLILSPFASLGWKEFQTSVSIAYGSQLSSLPSGISGKSVMIECSTTLLLLPEGCLLPLLNKNFIVCVSGECLPLFPLLQLEPMLDRLPQTRVESSSFLMAPTAGSRGLLFRDPDGQLLACYSIPITQSTNWPSNSGLESVVFYNWGRCTSRETLRLQSGCSSRRRLLYGPSGPLSCWL